MAWYEGTHSCGHEGRVNVIGPGKSRQWQIDRHFDRLCEDCFIEQIQKEREDALETARVQASEMELPGLTGTEKQINWAITLRQNFIEAWEKLYVNSEEPVAVEQNTERALMLEHILTHETRSSYYIDNFKGNFDIGLFYRANVDILKHSLKQQDEAEQNSKELAIIANEITLYPAEQTHPVPVELLIKNDTIQAFSPKDDDFREIVKSKRYMWSPDARCWQRSISIINGTPQDRASELANKLLAAGFAVTVNDEEVRRKAVDATYEPEHFKWVLLFTSGDYEGQLCIYWVGKSDSLYNKARTLTGARWVPKSGVAIRIEYYEEVQEFAELYNFRFRADAQQAIDAHIAKLASVERVSPAISANVEKQPDGLKEILKTKGEGVIDDLKDEPL